MSDTTSVKPADEVAWRALADCDVDDVCRRAAVTYDPDTRAYKVPVLGQLISVFPGERRMTADSPVGELTDLGREGLGAGSAGLATQRSVDALER